MVGQKLFMAYPRYIEWIHQYRRFLEHSLTTVTTLEERQRFMVDWTTKIVAVLPKALEFASNSEIFFADLHLGLGDGNKQYRKLTVNLFCNCFKNPSASWFMLNPRLLWRLYVALCELSLTQKTALSELLPMPQFFEYCRRLTIIGSDLDGLYQLTSKLLSRSMPGSGHVPTNFLEPLRAVWRWYVFWQKFNIISLMCCLCFAIIPSLNFKNSLNK